MSQSNFNQVKGMEVSLVGQLASSSTYDEVFLSCTAGYCIFDANQNLQAFSSDFPDLYPSIKDEIVMGMSYEQYLRLFYDKKAVQNLDSAENVDDWVKVALSLSNETKFSYTHHLHDGRWMRIDMSNTSTGLRLFVSNDITEARASQMALQENHTRFRSFAFLAMDWFWELDSDLNYVYHSGTKDSISGYGNKELVGMSRIQCVHELVVAGEQFEEHNKALREHRELNVVLCWRKNHGSVIHVNVIAKPEFDKHGNFTGYLGCGREVTQEIQLQARLNHLAEHDDLTGLFNRRVFESALSDILNEAQHRETMASLCFIDLDQFKLVNDGGGHEAGDQLLKNTANSFVELLSGDALVARLGGDEFGVILPLNANDALQEINKLIRHISSTPFYWKQRRYSIGASAGIATIDDQLSDISVLMSRADTACYLAKDAGRNQAQIYMYDEFFQDPVSLELKQVNLLKEAMDNDGLMLYLQPIKPIQFERTHAHFEVLLRLSDVDGNVKSAGEFIPVAEKYDLMQHLDKWVLCESLKILNHMFNKGLDVSFSINLSGNTLSNKDSFDLFRSIIDGAGIEPERLVFEITETVAIKNLSTAQCFINKMKEYGVSFSLDDFGSGLSSFGYLKNMPVDYLKIDGNFIKDIINDPTCKAIVSAFNQLSHELGMKTVAEFVEDAETESLLQQLGIDFAQGYGVGKPQQAGQWIEFLLENQSNLKKTG